MRKKNTVGLVTYHKALSYGACLQAYATAYVIENKLDCEVEFIDYENTYESRQKNWGFLKDGSFKEIVMTLAKRFIFKNEKCKNRAFEDFLKYQHLSSIHTTNINDLNSLDYDILVVGSDQVWNSNISNELDGVFLLDFAQPRKRISFASSMGGYTFNQSEKNYFQKCISQFNHISVREEYTRQQVQELTNKDIRILLDPTLLISGDSWRKMLEQQRIYYKYPKNSYILAFTIGVIDENVIKSYAYYSKKLKSPIYRIMLNTHKPHGIDKVISGATPYEFIELIDNAKFVITNSFHGTAFCINMNTPFVQIPVKNNNQRMSELLNFVGLSQQALTNDFDSISTEVDFSKSNEILSLKREDDLKWLEEVFQ